MASWTELKQTPYAGRVLTKPVDTSPSVMDEHAKTREKLNDLFEALDILSSIIPSPKTAAGVGMGAIKLFHGGNAFTKWNPKLIGTGERGFLAQGPGLYAGDSKDLATLYKKYATQDPALLELGIKDDGILEIAKKMTDEQLARLKQAEKELNKLGLNTERYGLYNAFLGGRPYNKEEVRQALVESGVPGLKQNLNNAYGSEFSIFDPEIIQSIKRIDK